MSRITGLSSITGLGSWVNQGADVSCTTDFNETRNSLTNPVPTNIQQIQGINATITLRINILFNDGGILRYSKDNESTFTSIDDEGTFTVVNGDLVSFQFEADGFGYSISFDVINQTDNNTNLGTITATYVFD